MSQANKASFSISFHFILQFDILFLNSHKLLVSGPLAAAFVISTIWHKISNRQNNEGEKLFMKWIFIKE
jgi:hypothetical protein